MRSKVYFFEHDTCEPCSVCETPVCVYRRGLYEKCFRPWFDLGVVCCSKDCALIYERDFEHDYLDDYDEEDIAKMVLETEDKI